MLDQQNKLRHKTFVNIRIHRRFPTTDLLSFLNGKNTKKVSKTIKMDAEKLIILNELSENMADNQT